MASLADELVLRIERASLVELAEASFLVDDGGVPADGDAERICTALDDAFARKNQFAAAEPKLIAGITDAIDTLVSCVDEDRALAFAQCKEALTTLFHQVLGPDPREVTSATYSPELQLRVLGLSIEAMREPILDVGSGPDAALVRHLRATGKEAHGIDARTRGDDVVTRASWLAFDYGERRYGTIVSHLGFTLHFMHQEMKRSDLAFEYARAYMRIAKALASGGTFAYVPPVPFIEALLPKASYRVVRVPLAKDLLVAPVERAQQATGLVLDAATHVLAT
jgi:hypothetical protein